jgi:hypothetical protein
MRSYLQWRARPYLENVAEIAPSELVLWIRLYDIPGPGQTPWFWREPVDVPLMRWRPHARVPLEWFDVTTRQFRPIHDAGANHD